MKRGIIRKTIRLMTGMVLVVGLMGLDAYGEMTPLGLSLKEAVVTSAVQSQTQIRRLDTPGVYGAQSFEILQGDVLITTPEVSLKNIIIPGRLVLNETIHSGNIHLAGVSADTLILKGNGSYTLTMTDCAFREILAEKNPGIVKIKVLGATQVGKMVMRSDFEIEAKSIRSSGIANLEIQGGERSKISGASVGSFALNIAPYRLDITNNSYLKNLTTSKPGAVVYLDSSCTVGYLKADQRIRFDGIGEIKKADINADGTILNHLPQELVLKTGVKAPTYTGTFIESFNPVDGTANFPVTSNLVIKFSKAMRLSTGTPLDNVNSDWVAALCVGKPNGYRMPVDATVSTSGNKTTVTVNPIYDLEPGQLYYLTVSGVEDIDNGEVVGPVQISFKAAEMKAPTVTEVTPADGAFEVPTNSEITIRFSELIRNADNSALTNDSVKKRIVLKKGGPKGVDEPFEAIVEKDRSQTVIRLLTTYIMENGQTYYLAVKDLEDESNQLITGKTEYTFSTSKNWIVPRIRSILPGNGQAGIPLNENIIVSLSHLMRLPEKTPLTNENVDSAVSLRMDAPNGAIVPADVYVMYQGSTMQLVVDPIADLAPDRSYHLSIDLLEDLTGQPLEGTHQFTFRTRPEAPLNP